MNLFSRFEGELERKTGGRDRPRSRVDRSINRARQRCGVISRGEKLNGVVPSKGRPYVEENGTMAVARPPEMESVKLTEGMDREREARHGRTEEETVVASRGGGGGHARAL